MRRLPPSPYTFLPRTPESKLNILRLLAHSPATVEHWISVGNAQFTDLQLGVKLRELAILYVCARCGSEYEWGHHVRFAERMEGRGDGEGGVGKGEREWLKGVFEGRRTDFENGEGKEGFKEVFDERERVMLRFLEAVVDGPEIEDGLWEETRRWFSEREVVELISLQGFYYMISRLGTVLKVDMDEWAKPKM